MLFASPSENVSSVCSGLSAIRNAGVNFAVWERAPDPRCEPAIRALLSTPCEVALDFNPATRTEINEAIAEITRTWCTPAAASALAEDIWLLVKLFSEIADSQHARVRLERIEDNGCLLFHADSLRLRMLCTYAGPGTEWVHNDNARFEELGLRGRSVEDANRAIVINKDEIRLLRPWHVAAFSGRQREDTLPLIHRSAPVCSAADYRLRLCIDLPDACG